MRIVMYKNPNAIFDFLFPDVIDRLKYYSDQNVGEATEILDAVVRGGGIGSSITGWKGASLAITQFKPNLLSPFEAIPGKTKLRVSECLSLSMRTGARAVICWDLSSYDSNRRGRKNNLYVSVIFYESENCPESKFKIFLGSISSGRGSNTPYSRPSSGTRIFLRRRSAK